jgi:hypothetical protein
VTAALAAAARPAFGRHETFHPRYGWLRKAFSAALFGGADAFTREDATVRLGVGKNMVHAIRYWGLAFKVIEEVHQPDRPRLPGLRPSAFGDVLLGDDGWDSYLEDPASLWLLHWKLLSPPCLAPVWWLAFNTLTATSFTEGKLLQFVQAQLADLTQWPAVVEGSVKKDVDCLIRMYASRRTGRQTLDDVVDCPFRELRLMDLVPGEGRLYRFAPSSRSAIPDVMVAYASLDFMARTAPTASTSSIARLATEQGSPGMVFRLTELDVFAALGRVAAATRKMQVAEPAGVRQLLIFERPQIMASDLLGDYYAERTGSRRRLEQVATPRSSTPSTATHSVGSRSRRTKTERQPTDARRR